MVGGEDSKYRCVVKVGFQSPPDLPFLNFWNFWKFPKRYFDAFGRFSKLISISVSAVGCSWFFSCRQCYFLAQKLSGETKTDVQKKVRIKYVSKKGRLPTFCGPQKLANVILFMYFWYIILYFAYKRTYASFLLTLNQKLADVPPGKNVGKDTPQKKTGGLIVHRKQSKGA
jgi:hypothetical protein